MSEFFHIIFRTLRMVITPGTYRRIFMGQIRVAVYLKSGAVVKFNCTNFDYSLNPGEKQYSVKGLTDMVAFDPSEMIAMREVGWF